MSKPANAREVIDIVKQRVDALGEDRGTQETVTVEWRGAQKSLPVIDMPVDLLHYNPGSLRIQAQRSLDEDKSKALDEDPYGADSQAYVHSLLLGDPAEPTEVDKSFIALKEDLNQHGQTHPAVIRQDGVLINGNTRRAVCQELGREHLRVGVLPPDTNLTDVRNIELSLQLRKEYKREYSYMNRLLAIDNAVQAGRHPREIQKDFHMKPERFEREIWILAHIREAIDRSVVDLPDGTRSSMHLNDFEEHQGKLEETARAYLTLKPDNSEKAERLKEQRLMALVFGKSKTDLRHIEPDFSDKYMKVKVPSKSRSDVKIPGTSITTPGPSPEVEALSERTNEVLKAKVMMRNAPSMKKEDLEEVTKKYEKTGVELEDALDKAGRDSRLLKRKLDAATRLGDACDDLEAAVSAVAEARSTKNFDPDSLDAPLMDISKNLKQLAVQVAKAGNVSGDGLDWLREVGSLEVGSLD